MPDFDLLKTDYISNKLTLDEKKLLSGTFRNRDILNEGLNLFESIKFDHEKFGKLLNEHHEILRDTLKISTPKIEKMISASLEGGALGAKINGSGGGGCMFAYAPNNVEAVAEAIERVGGKAYILNMSEGTLCLEN
jgi:galactokinase